jgi:hypothetical protein
VHAAAARLAAAHLQVWAKGRVDPHVDPGTVIAQFPRPGARVPRDTPITIVDATGSKQRTVPDLSGKTPAQADAELRHLGLALGTIQPDAAAFDAPIRAQIPAAGQRARVGTPVNVSIRPGTSPRPDGVVSGAGVLPATPTPTLTPATPHGSAASTSVFAFDNGRDVFVSRRGSVSAITHESGAHRAVEPALSPDGRYVAYVTLDGAGRGRLWLAGLRGARTAATPLAITGDLHRPAFSPDGRALAFIRKTSLSGGRLCLVTGAGSRPKVRCLPRGGWAINRPAWSPSGHAIAATATRGTATAVVTYRASGRRWALTQTQVMLLGARSVAWLSDGAHVAAIGYGDGYHLYLLGADPRQGLSGDIHPLSVVHGCTVSAAAGGAVAVSVWDCVEARDASIVLVSPDAPETQRVIGHGFDPAFPAPRRG